MLNCSTLDEREKEQDRDVNYGFGDMEAKDELDTNVRIFFKDRKHLL